MGEFQANIELPVSGGTGGGLPVSIGITSNPRTWPILDGKARPEGISLIPTILHPSELFWRQLTSGDFDIAEMSVSTWMMITAAGDERFVGIPVFTTRSFFHTNILVRRDAGIDKPEDLKGKRVGVPEYQQTAALWIRGALQHEFGVHPRDMHFWMERNPDKSHGAAVGFSAPDGVAIDLISPDSSIGEMMVSGELDAVIFYLRARNLVDRSSVDLWNHPDIKPLFPDTVAEGIRYYQKTGLYPINHGMVIKRDLAERHPWIILNLLKAFKHAAELADIERQAHISYHVETGLIEAGAREAAKVPLVRHGVVANQNVLVTAAQYSYEQGLTPRPVGLEEMFAPATLNQ